jgi:hypothetical protein
MHDDESLAAARESTGASAPPGIKLPAPAWTKAANVPGGIPPMFDSGAHVQPADTRADAFER